jgi:predicted DNA-binding ribbon-helix-helix protein
LKRSVTVAGHRTSLSLEDEFWQALAAAAREESKTIAALIADIDRDRLQHNLSSAIRVWILKRLLDRTRRSLAPASVK